MAKLFLSSYTFKGINLYSRKHYSHSHLLAKVKGVYFQKSKRLCGKSQERISQNQTSSEGRHGSSPVMGVHQHIAGQVEGKV